MSDGVSADGMSARWDGGAGSTEEGGGGNGCSGTCSTCPGSGSACGNTARGSSVCSSALPSQLLTEGLDFQGPELPHIPDAMLGGTTCCSGGREVGMVAAN